MMPEMQSVIELKELRLHGMADALERIIDQPDAQSLTAFEVLAFIIEAERHDREEKRLKRFRNAAKLKIYDANLDNLDYRPKRGLDKALIKKLRTSRWAVNNHHIILLGATGVGKTYLACALANQAIIDKFRIYYARLPLLLESMEKGRKDGTLSDIRHKLSKFDVLILDDWGVSALTDENRADLFEIVEQKTGTGSIIITSQLPVNKWHDWIDDPTRADAILDRLVHRAHTIKLKGDSMRKVLGLNEEK